MADDRGYRVLLTFAPEAQVFRARVPELGIDLEGDSRGDALSKAEAAIEAKFAATAQSGEELSPPSDHEVLGGELTLALAPLVMQDLTYFARQSDQSPAELGAQLLARAVGMLHGSARPTERRPERREEERREGGDDRPRGRGNRREGYRPDLDDKSNWLAYLREQEKGGGGGGGGGRGRR